jgi:WD40 repeat protein
VATAVQTRPPEAAAGIDAYDCFVSYARDPDEKLAEALRNGLAGLAKPWYRRRALRVFLDRRSLSASPELWPAILAALEHSRFFILVASPEAAARPWVDREVAWWREHRDPQSVLIADRGAKLRWDDRLGDFAADATIPPSLRGWLPAEPTWTDLSWARDGADLSLRNARFSDHVADLAAPVRGMRKDALVDEDIRQHRRALRLAWGAAGALLLLAVAAALAAIVAVSQRHQALVQRDRARAQALAALAEATRGSDPLTSLRDATRSLAIRSTPQAVRALRGTLALPLRRVFNTNEGITGLAFSPDGRWLAQGGRGGVSLHDLRTGRLVAGPADGPTFIANFAFDASGRTLATVGQVGSVNVMQLTHPGSRDRPRTLRFGSLADGTIAPDGRSVALRDQSGELVLRDLGSGRDVVLDRHARPFFALRFSADGRRLLGVGEQRLRIWSTAPAGGAVDIAAGHPLTARITSAGTVVGVDWNGTVTTWSADGAPLRRTHLALGPDPSVALSADGRLAAVGSGSKVAVWDLVAGGRRAIGSHPGGGITAVAFGPGERSLASVAQRDTLIRVWDLRTGPPAPTRGHDFFATFLTASADGLVAGAEGDSSALAVWPRAGASRRVFHGGAESILAVGFMPGGGQVLTVSDDGAARLVDAATGRRRLVRDRLGSADVAALSPDRRRVAVAVDGGPLRVWKLAGGSPVTLARHTHGIYRLSLSADGHVAAATGKRHVDVWSVRGGPPVRLPAPQPIELVDFARTGHALAAGAGAAPAGVYLWRRLDPRAGPVLLGRQEHFVDAVAFSPDGSGVASACDSGPVYLWTRDGSPGTALAAATAQSTTGLAFDPTGRTLLLSDGTLRVLACAACGPARRLIAEADSLARHGGLPAGP